MTMRSATLLVVLLSCAAQAAEDRFYADLDVSRFREIATLDDGRKKPLDSLAREKVETVCGSASIEGQDPVVTFLSMVFEPEKWIDNPVVQVRDKELAGTLGIQRKGTDGKAFVGRWISQNEWRRAEASGDLQEKFNELSKDTSKVGVEKRDRFRKAVEDVAGRAGVLARMADVFLPVPCGTSKERPWVTLAEAGEASAVHGGKLRELDGLLRAGFAAHDAARVNLALTGLADLLPKVNPEVYATAARLSFETFINVFRPLRWAMFIFFAATLLSLVQLGIGRHLWLPLLAAGAAIGFTLFWVVGRGVLAERWPLGNFFEVMVMSAAVVTMIGFVLSAVYRSSYFVASGAFLSGMILMIGETMVLLEYRILSPLVPVLRSYWMQYHVTCMVGAYSGATLAFGVSIVYLLGYGFGKRAPEHLALMETYIYRTVQVAFVFFTAGIMLGGLWANESWGRYWGWDPKEIWALICWLIYAVYLHGRMIGWCRGLTAAWACVAGFLAVLMTFYGVNFWLKGLHSYAN